MVTTTRVTHATPASLYANSADRDWECWHHLNISGVADRPEVEDIAYQWSPDSRNKNILSQLHWSLKHYYDFKKAT